MTSVATVSGELDEERWDDPSRNGPVNPCHSKPGDRDDTVPD
jgi:hypothetical protein